MIKKYLPQSTEEMIRWYERYVAPIALLLGFLLDSFVLLDRVDVLFGNIVLLSYLVLAGIGIVTLNIVASGRIQNRALLAISPFVPVIVQFFFGALFSAYLSLYSRSAGIALSWIFVLGLALLLVGNERFRVRYTKLSFQIAIYFTALYSFLIFFIPLIFKKIGTPVFILSGLVSVLVIAFLVAVLRILVPERVREAHLRIGRNIFGIYIMFNVLYFSNLIPPLPLALKESGVFHSIVRTGAGYRLTEEKKPWRVRYLNAPADVHIPKDSDVYVFTAIFAPSGLTTSIRHEWQLYDDLSNQWETLSNVKFSIRGGRDGGFRGYSKKFNPAPGEWRVNVLTESGLVIGRTYFIVKITPEPPVLVEVEK